MRWTERSAGERTGPVAGSPDATDARHSDLVGRRVLIVEDDSALRENLVEVFGLDGFAVSAAENGESALALLGRGAPPDVVLLDYALPDLNGGEVFDLMKKAACVPPTVLLTGDERATELAAQHGMTCAIRKPFDTAALVAVVSTLAGRSSGS